MARRAKAGGLGGAGMQAGGREAGGGQDQKHVFCGHPHSHQGETGAGLPEADCSRWVLTGTQDAKSRKMHCGYNVGLSLRAPSVL